MSTMTDAWHLSCNVNGEAVELDIDPAATLLAVLRDHLQLTGSKGACLEGECGSCTVLVNGRSVNSCLMLAAQVQDRDVRTIEGTEADETLHALQRQFVATGAAQCGYCTPGLIMAAKALLDGHPDATDQELTTAIEANICRCTGYESIRQAIRQALQEVQR